MLVAGAGLAGLAAARTLEGMGAVVSVIEARDRVGGRVWTIRDGFARGQFAEGGADLIEPEQTALLGLARACGLRTSTILRGGFAYYGADNRGRVTVQRHFALFEVLYRELQPYIGAFRLSELRWGSPILQAMARTSVAAWLDQIGADARMRQRLRGLRGLFLADPEDLSLLALVDFFATNVGGSDRLLRLTDGNDRLATEVARRLATPPDLGAILRRVGQDRRGVTAAIETRQGLTERRADYLVCALPATTLRDVVFVPKVPPRQWAAISTLAYGHATRVLLQFSRRHWRRRGRPLAFGSDQPTGAVWDGNEQQRGPHGILSLLAGGGASGQLQALLASGGPAAVASHLTWIGRPGRLVASHALTWEAEPWSRGGYAYFDARFNPADRDLLLRPFGRVFFAGEHTSIRWQGYMNGAVESGQRAAHEISAGRHD